jgi:non-ribosomal peptide synthetase component F
MQNLESLDIEVEGLKFKKYQLKEEEETSVDISLTAFEINEIIELSFVYCIGLFKRDTILRLSKDFQTILITILQDLNCKLENISLLNEKEKADMKLEIEELEDFSSVKIDF